MYEGNDYGWSDYNKDHVISYAKANNVDSWMNTCRDIGCKAIHVYKHVIIIWM